MISQTAVVNEPTAVFGTHRTRGTRGRAEGDDFKIAHGSQKKSVFVEVPFEMANSMQAGLVASSSAPPRAFPAIVVGGLIVSAVDLLYAIAVYSPRHPILIPQTIASGILGAKSYSEGTLSSALGIVLQFVIALGASTVYYLASRRLKFLVSHAVPSGLTYGALVYLFMHIVVLPLSAVPKGDTPFVYMAFEFVEHWFCVGLPIALSVHHYSH